jgi:predicted Zn finger-like uncharacterized protein
MGAERNLRWCDHRVFVRVFDIGIPKQRPMQEPLEFSCPHCRTAYRVVQIQADVHSDAKVDCLVCGRPLQASDERSFFKYFLVDPLQVSLRQLLATDRNEMYLREDTSQ